MSRMSEPVNRESWDAALATKKPLSPVKKEHKTQFADDKFLEDKKTKLITYPQFCGYLQQYAMVKGTINDTTKSSVKDNLEKTIH